MFITGRFVLFALQFRNNLGAKQQDYGDNFNAEKCHHRSRINSSNFTCRAKESLFCVFCIRNTIRNVTIVVPVFITSCQVSLNLKIGPVMIQIMIVDTAIMKAIG